MENKTLELTRPPEFSGPDEEGRDTVSLTALDWARMLKDLNVTDPQVWPPGLREGAGLLARIRQIEADCIARHKHFDWEKLEADTQDEYDNARADLNLLLYPDRREWKTLEQLAAELGVELGKVPGSNS